MQPNISLKKIQDFFSILISKYYDNRTFILLSIFLFVVILISFIIPFLFFGRFFGTDDYSHLFHTNQMTSSRGISEFYEKIGLEVSDPNNDTNEFNYPFGLWLFGATIAKTTGLPPITAEFIFVILFFLILVISFYIYSSTWLKSREQKLFAVLFLISMPQISLYLLSYRPSMFIVPFLLIVLMFFLKEPVNWKLLPIAWLSIFIIIISHTGTFLFLFSFSMAFFLLYCLFWGKFSRSLFVIILSILVIYVISLKWFPDIAYQYDLKSRFLLLPGNFFATKFNFLLPNDLVGVFYQPLLVEQQFIYAVILGAILFVIGKFLIYIHRKTATILSKSENLYAFILPIQNLPHSVVASPLWLGPIQVIFSVFGFFHLDNKGKCLLITGLLTTLLPDLLQAGVFGPTGALREISYLMVIIPITATLGFWHILDYLNDPLSNVKTLISWALWIVVCLAIIITPILGNMYYLPAISGENYVTSGLKWLGENGDSNEKVVGYTLRSVPIYTNMIDATYGLQLGSELGYFLTYLNNIYFNPENQINQAKDFKRSFGVKYILSSDKLLRIFGRNQEDLIIDSNTELSKIYASNDFGIYEITTSTENPIPDIYLPDSISLKHRGSTYEVDSGYYKVVLRDNTPRIIRFGTPEKNFLGAGFIKENIRISGTELNPDGDLFGLGGMEFTPEIMDNQITYRTILRNPTTQSPEGTLIVRYTFYPTVIKREYVVSNDWVIARSSPQMTVDYSMQIYSPMLKFVAINDKARLERSIYPSDDQTELKVNIQDFFISDGKNGIYLTFAALSPQPSSLWYVGTIYKHSSVGITQSTKLKPGASFLSTQFLSLGSESDAKKNIQTIQGIDMINYPDGIIPILLSGYRTPKSDNKKMTTGYEVLNNYSIPYAEVITPTIDLQELLKNNITIIGSENTGEGRYDDYTTQETNIKILTNYIKNQSILYTGFMPDSFNYNLDTLSILSSNKIPFIFSSLTGAYTKGSRNPQIAYVNSEPTGVVLFPVSYPSSSSELSNPVNKEVIFSGWKATINAAANNDEMVLLSLRSEDIGDPAYTDDFIQLFSYAREKGLTLTTPNRIADHFKLIQNIHYSGLIEGDMASLRVTNTNNVTVGNVTFKVTLPELEDGNYRVSDGRLVKTKTGNGQSVVYISMEVPANSTKNIKIEPDMQKNFFVIEMPQLPITEGSNIITVKDEVGNPLPNVDVILDSSYLQTDKNGEVHLDLERGTHTIIIQSLGYEKYAVSLNVKGRIHIIEQIIGKYFDQ